LSILKDLTALQELVNYLSTDKTVNELISVSNLSQYVFYFPNFASGLQSIKRARNIFKYRVYGISNDCISPGYVSDLK
jgi:hypothetical protein